jgi:hypothetical protein
MPLRRMVECRYSSTILDLGTKWIVSGQLHAPAALPLGDSPRYPLDRRLGGLQSRFGRCGDKKILLALMGIEPRPSRP